MARCGPVTIAAGKGIKIEMNLTKKSKLLSRILRHSPESVGLSLDTQGYVEVTKLLSALARNGSPLSLSELQKVVQTNDKKRFAFSSDGLKIRAVQGHSVTVDLELKEASPPPYLFHGTVSRFLASIQNDGLKPMQRHHVHLSQDRSQAFKVGSRRGKAIILKVSAQAMQKDGYLFYLAENGVWLTEIVPPEYIELLS